ncbi:LacI family DNA-binding transcriptional regulator [Cerasicoccus maritimus]|uniref:LacI family DNA-binding transcriptional regulator n=1 Tax=Cerasicoccus maritimus TaxID=490089 RepID=UPI0028525635|nr:LacI family DNA-binding transcriptional regulator [Cerasicoccus maritimus]
MKNKRRATIRDVAQASGYSIYTVSSVLNNKGDISEATSEKVRQVARELNYDLLGNVSAARRMTTRSIGIVLPEAGCMHDGFYNRAVSTFRAIASNRDYDCKLFAEEDITRRLDPSKSGGIYSLGCKGLVVFCPNGDYKNYISQLLSNGVAVGLIRRKVPKMDGLFQAADNDEASMKIILKYLYEEVGSRRMVMLSNVTRTKVSGGREKAFKKFTQENLAEGDSMVIFESALKDDSSEKEEFFDFLRESKAKGQVPVVSCWSDSAASRLMTYLHRSGFQVPGDVMITGYDNDPYSSHADITTMSIPIEEMVTACCRYLFEYREEGDLPEAKTQRFKHELVVRGSTEMISG